VLDGRIRKEIPACTGKQKPVFPSTGKGKVLAIAWHEDTKGR